MIKGRLKTAVYDGTFILPAKNPGCLPSSVETQFYNNILHFM